MDKQPSGDATSVWAWGIVEPGWYCACWGWDGKFAEHLKQIGYRVVRSIGKPTPDGRPTDIRGNPMPVTV